MWILATCSVSKLLWQHLNVIGLLQKVFVCVCLQGSPPPLPQKIESVKCFFPWYYKSNSNTCADVHLKAHFYLLSFQWTLFPSIHLIYIACLHSGHGCAAAYPSWLWVKGGYTVNWSPAKSWEQIDKQLFTFTPWEQFRVFSQHPFQKCGRKREHLVHKQQSNMQTPYGEARPRIGTFNIQKCEATVLSA